MRALLISLLLLAACAAEVETPAAPGYPVDDEDGGVAASSEVLTIVTRSQCSPNPVQMLHANVAGIEGLLFCGNVVVSSGQAWICPTQSGAYNVIYRIYSSSASSAHAEVYHVDSVGSHAAYRIHCSCPNSVFGGSVTCITSPF